MSTAIAAPQSSDIEKVLLTGDLSKLSPDQRLSYYNRVCESLKLNPLTKPFAYLNLNGKTVLYATKDCTEQLRSIHAISLQIVQREVTEGCYVVTARAVRVDGRTDESIGAVPIENLKGEARSNAMMKCETKAKRRVTLSICGLGMLDESEVDSIPGGSREAQQEVAQRRLAELRQIPAGSTISPQDIADVEPEPGDGIVEYVKREAAKIAEASEALNPPRIRTDAEKKLSPPMAPRKRGSIPFDALKHFGVIKKALMEETGDDAEYYRILKGYGYDHADEIVDKEEARSIYKILAGAHARAVQDAELENTLTSAQEALGIPKFMAILGAHGQEKVSDVLAMDGTPLENLLSELKQAIADQKGTHANLS